LQQSKEAVPPAPGHLSSEPSVERIAADQRLIARPSGLMIRAIMPATLRKWLRQPPNTIRQSCLYSGNEAGATTKH